MPARSWRRDEISRRTETPLALSLAPGFAGDRVVVRADQKDFTVTRAAVRDFEVQATNPETS
jgi:hypothetical protein